jgi:hypothetical protein
MKRGVFLKPHLWLIKSIGVLVPHRLRADWPQEWRLSCVTADSCWPIGTSSTGVTNWTCYDGVSARFAMCCSYNPNDWRTRCFKTYDMDARVADLLWLVIRQGFRLTLACVALGLGGAFGLTRLLERLLFGCRGHRPADLRRSRSHLESDRALAACYIPARRATKVDRASPRLRICAVFVGQLITAPGRSSLRPQI